METPSPDRKGLPSFGEDDKIKFDDVRKSQKGQRWLSEERWKALVSILRDGIRPRETLYTAALQAKGQYFWDDEVKQLRRKRDRRIVVQPSRIFDTLRTEHEKQHRRKPVFPDYISARYVGITRVESNLIIKLCRRCQPPRPSVEGSDDDGDPPRSNPESRTSSEGQLPATATHCLNDRDTVTSNGSCTVSAEHYTTRRPEVDNDSQESTACSLRTAPEKTRQCIEWLKRIRDREWPESLERSRYRYIISGLCTILEVARPANTYYRDSKAEGEVCAASYGSASYGSADLLRLSMQEATVELAKSEGTIKPILIPHDATTTRRLKTIAGILKQLEHHEMPLDVQDLKLPHDMPSTEKQLITDVIPRFAPGRSSEEEPPINILNLDCPEQRVEPDCVVTENMNFLSYLKPDTMRSVDTSTSIWLRCEKWRLLGQGGSGSMTHQDHCGFWTWVKIEEGEKLWLICQLSDRDREAFAIEGCSFTGGQWLYVWLRPGDVLIMPPGTVHAVFSPVNTLCAGGNVWSQKHMGETMRSIAFENEHPDVTNDDEVPQLPALLEQASRRINGKASAAIFGGEAQIEMFNKYYEKYKERRRSSIKRPSKTDIEESLKRMKTSQKQTARGPSATSDSRRRVKKIEAPRKQTMHLPRRVLTRSSTKEQTLIEG